MNYFKEETEKDTTYFLAHAIIKSVNQDVLARHEQLIDIDEIRTTADTVLEEMFAGSVMKEQTYELENLFFEIEMFIRRECTIESLGSTLILGVLYSLSGN